MREDLELALIQSGLFPPDVRVDGRIRWLENGANHRNYYFYLQGDNADTGALVYRESLGQQLSDEEHPISRLQREAQTLQDLARQTLPFCVPRFVCFVHDSHERIKGMIETAAPGIGLDYVKKLENRQEFVLDCVARIAAAVHRLDPAEFKHLADQEQRRNRLLAQLQSCESEPAANNGIRAAVTWAREHLPTNGPACVVHGDLLPQNLLWNFEGDQLSVIDWEYARISDPADELAIVTRGHRHPFGRLGGGLRQFVERYRENGGAPVEWTEVVSYELIMNLNWWRQAVQDEHEGVYRGHPSASCRDQIVALLRRAEGRGKNP